MPVTLIANRDTIGMITTTASAVRHREHTASMAMAAPTIMSDGATATMATLHRREAAALVAMATMIAGTVSATALGMRIATAAAVTARTRENRRGERCCA
ncbi:MAG: hypothetical protein NVS3B5_03010 [Sphingomicrobium sp.]